MRRKDMTAILITLVMVATSLPAHAFVKPQQVPSGPEEIPMLMKGSPPRAETQQRWGEFVAHEGGDWDAVRNPVTTTPHRIFSNQSNSRERYLDDVMISSNDTLPGDGLCDDTCDEPYGLPLRFSLGPALPNPARRSVTVTYAVPSPGADVSIHVFDVQGRLTTTLLNKAKAPGRYVARWDGVNAAGDHVAAGVYFVRMQSSDFSASSKVMLLR